MPTTLSLQACDAASQDELSKLVAQAHSHCSHAGSAQRELLSVFESRLAYIVRSLHIPDSDWDDAMQGARLGFLQALARFEPARGVKLITFASHYIKGAALKAVYGTSRYSQHGAGKQASYATPQDLHPVYLSQLDPDQCLITYFEPAFGDGSEDDIRRAVMHQRVRDWVANLPPLQRDLIEGMFWGEERQADIARRRAVSRKSVHVMLDRVLEKGRVALNVA